MDTYFERGLFGFTLLFIGTTCVTECQPTVDRESNECNCARDNHLSSLLIDMKNTIDSITIRLERADCVQETKPCSPNIASTDNKPGIPIISTALNGSNYVAAIAYLNDELFVTREGVAQVSVYNVRSFQLHRQLTFDGLGSKVVGLATCVTHSYLYISDQFNYCIHRVSISNTGAPHSLIHWNVAEHPNALSVNRARNILVAFGDASKVKEYTPTGTLVRTIGGGGWLFQAIELSFGVLAVSRSGPSNHGVVTLSMSSQLIHSYGNGEGSGARQMSHSRGLSADNCGYILVADRENNRIVVLNPSLTDARTLPLPVHTALQYPYSLALDPSRGRLYVGERGGENRLLVIDNVTNVGTLFHN